MDDLDRWTGVRALGAGAFGQVNLAWDTQELRWVAVKRFNGHDELGLLRFVIESRIRVEHPHLVRTLAFRLVDDQAWLVTELARGGSLRQVMSRKGPLPWGWVVDVVDQLLDALGALHATGVVHRDLKPANLLLRDAGEGRPHLLVGDFGIATWRTVSMTGIGAAIGTPGYLAPEYLDGRQPSPQTDLFAVGVLAAELLAGARLIHHSNATADIPADWSAKLPMPATVPASVAAVLRRIADPDPARRYQDCTEALTALRTAAPEGARPDLAGVVDVLDLLADLPHGWTLDGPVGARQQEPPTVVTPRHLPTMPGPALGPPTPPPMPVYAPGPWREEIAPPPTRNGRGRAVALAAAVVVVLAVAVGGYLAVANRTADQTAKPDGRSPTVLGGEPARETGPWTPVVAARCTLAERGNVRTVDDRRQRCQRNPAGDQDWVLEPEGGFPKSNPAGPFGGEACRAEADTDFSPTGDPVTCHAGKWQAAS